MDYEKESEIILNENSEILYEFLVSKDDESIEKLFSKIILSFAFV
jgi:hypothetical protein